MKKLNKKGFTLIELLAVIVILAIILVIAVPAVLNIQNNAKIGAFEDQALLIVKSIELCVSAEENPSTTCASNNFDEWSKDYYEGNKPTTLNYSIEGGKVTNIAIGDGTYCSTGASKTSITTNESATCTFTNSAGTTG